jgi:import receptor subunit TOM20
MSARSATQIALLTAATAVTGLVGYAVYFDYMRRNNPEFRKNIRECAIGRTGERASLRWNQFAARSAGAGASTGGDAATAAAAVGVAVAGGPH